MAKNVLPKEVTARREALTQCGGDSSALDPAATLGIAFSGGGIRSATISLGVAQALARRNRLLAFDYMSTVSGGGYFGSFLRSLYLPQNIRGPLGVAGGDPATQFEFANKVLESEPHQRTVDGPKSDFPAKAERKIANPIWWLREHSRYLAPNGPTDFVFAISHIARNWLAMLYVFVVATIALFTIKTGLVALLVIAAQRWDVWPTGHWGWLQIRDVTFSPVAPLVAIAVFISLAVGVAFWMTEAMHLNPSWLYARAQPQDAQPSSRRYFAYSWLGTFAGLAAVHLIVRAWPFAALGMAHWPPISPSALFLFQLGEAFTLIMLGFAAAAFAHVTRKYDRAYPHALTNPTAELRRVLTLWLSNINKGFAILLAIAVIDTLAIALHDRLARPFAFGGVATFWTASALPAAAWLIKSVPEWVAKLSGGKQRALQRLGPAIATMGGLLLFGVTAILADTIVHRAAWQGPVLFGAFDGPTFVVFAIVVAALVILTGLSDGFINLSSLHAFYAARLTRAYVGATNIDRLRDGRDSRVDVNKSKDYIDVGLYLTAAIPAPVHLINVTLNDTIGTGDNLFDRARKGFLLTFAPEGTVTETTRDGKRVAAGWDRMRDGHSEPLGLGQLCAISGAAASAGMGRMTTLGGALSFTFANVRLGYWWTRGDAFDALKPAKKTLGRLIETFRYLFNEMTARYSLNYRRLYLSDGGHFENSGALALLARDVDLIVVCDNGCDPGASFGDLEILIRTARLDLGRYVEVATPGEVTTFAGEEAASLFLNGADGDWRARAAAPGGQAFALLLKVAGPESRASRHVVWLKPRMIDGLAADVEGYAAAHPAFPHETAGDQFFDEAQWESYRRLGFDMADLLIDRSGALRTRLPAISITAKPSPAPRTARSPSPRPARRRSSPA